MQRLLNHVMRVCLKGCYCGLPAVFLAASPVHACTIFTLTDTNQVLFCNNEDWSDPKTKIWFIPPGGGFLSSERKYGAAYVGFDNMWAQGGVNTEGLAFDWVAGFKETWEPDPKLKPVKGNAGERMLESCATLEEAVVFFRTHWDRNFSYAKMLVADRTGASAIIGSADGHLDIKVAKQSRGFGFGGQVVERMLGENPAPTLTNAAKILEAARQKGQYATKYSNVFDLKSGDMFVFRFPEHPDAVKLNLGKELKLGRHAYDIPELSKQLGQ